ncbi:PREDICTED: pentatricopeptide repeat-containing protein At3g13880-like, partial [Tarenaya hassleriana]
MLLIFRTKILSNKNCAASCTTHLSERFGTSCEASPSPCGPKSTALDSVTYTKLVQTAAKSGSMVLGKLAHARMIKTSFNPCLFLLNNMLNMYSKCGELGFARYLLDGMPQRNIISFNSLISGYTQMGYHDRVMDLFVEARESGLKLDKFTYAGALSVCGESCHLELGKVLHGLVTVNGLAEQVFLINVLIDMYCKCGKLDEARYLFDNSKELDQVSWNSLISGYVRIGATKEPLNLLAEMHRNGLKLTTYTLGSSLKACCLNFDYESMAQGMAIHGYVTKLGMESDVVVGTALLDMYAKNGRLKDSVKIFNLMPDKNVVMYNAMLSGFLQLDDITDES